MSTRRALTALSLAFILCAGTIDRVFAQGTAQISGRVTDGTGGVLPGVTVTATQTETGLARSAVTNEAGQYTLPSLPLGPYRFEATLPGFRTFIQEGITLLVNASLVIDPVLEVGQVAESISVTAQPSDIEVEMRGLGVGTVVESERIVELPLNARQVTDLITLSGAAVQVGQSPSWGMATGVNIAVAGGQRFGVSYTLDGAVNTNRFDQTNMPMPFPDALQEFRVSTSSQEAATGRASGASVNAVTTSGTNQLRGNVFWFVRDARFNARKADTLRDDGLRRNQPGFAIGGPIARNRLFFFAAYQSTITTQEPSDTLSIVPTQAMLTGDWRAFNQCYRPSWRDPDFVDGIVDPARYNGTAVQFAARLPRAQTDCGEIQWGNTVERHDKQSVTRIDYQLNERHGFFGRYMATLQNQPVQFSSSNLLTASANGAGFDDNAHSSVLGHTWLISPTMLSASRVAYNRVTVEKRGARFFNPEDVGITQWTSVPGHFILGVTGLFSVGSGPTAKREMWQNQVQAGSDLTWTRGAHQFEFGGMWERADVLSLAHTRGVGGITISANTTGNAMGDFLLGRVDNIRQSMPSTLSPYQHYLSLYAQDEWRATSRLTVNYGVRWEPYLPMVWKENPLGGIRVYNFSVEAFRAGRKSAVFPNAPAGFTYPSQNADGSGSADFEGHSGVQRSWNKWAPRVGVAWDPVGAGRTSIRGGYGLAYDLIELQSLLNSNNVSPWALDIIHRNGTLDNPWLGLAGGNPFPFDWRMDPRFAEGSVFIPFGADLNMTYVQTWNAGVQQQFAGRWLASATYLGSYSSRLWNTTAVNPALTLSAETHSGLFTGPDTCVLEGRSWTPCNQVGNIAQRRELRLWAAANNPALLPDARFFANIDEYRADSTAGYHGLLASVRGSISGVNLNANYTLSKCTSDRVNVGVSNPNQTFHNPETKDRGRCASDRRRIFNLTGVASSPQFEHPMWRAIASDWRLSLIYRLQSGLPLTIIAGSDRAATGLADQVVDRVGADVYQDRSGGLRSQFLSRSAFALPVVGTYGNAGFFSVTGLHMWDLDVALSRILNVGTHRLELRAEAFNVTNAARPASMTGTIQNDPTVNFANPNFGRVISVRDPRIMQFAVKYVF